jgi:hypothetical protein
MNRFFEVSSGDGVGEAFEAVHYRQHDIIDTPVLELVHDAKPELGPFILLDPQPKHLLAAIRTNAEGNEITVTRAITPN